MSRASDSEEKYAKRLAANSVRHSASRNAESEIQTSCCSAEERNRYLNVIDTMAEEDVPARRQINSDRQGTYRQTRRLTQKGYLDAFVSKFNGQLHEQPFIKKLMKLFLMNL